MNGLTSNRLVFPFTLRQALGERKNPNLMALQLGLDSGD